MIWSNSSGLLVLRPLVTMEKRMAPASLALRAAWRMLSSSMKGYSWTPVLWCADCAQNLQFSGHLPDRALTMAHTSTELSLKCWRILSAIASRIIVSSSEVWISSIASSFVISPPFMMRFAMVSIFSYVPTWDGCWSIGKAIIASRKLLT